MTPKYQDVRTDYHCGGVHLTTCPSNSEGEVVSICRSIKSRQ